MANEKFTQLPTVTSALMADIICAVQAGTSSQETLGQVFSLFLANAILNYAGNPNGNVAGVIYQLCWDSTDSLMYVCTTSGNAATAVWSLAGGVSLPVSLAQGGTGASLTASAGAIPYSGASAMAFSAVGSSGQFFQSNGASAPSWTTFQAGSGVTLTPGSGTLTISATGSGGTVTSITAGTGLTGTPNPITGSGTIALTVPVSLANGGTNASLTASNGGLIYSTGSAMAILAGTATANQIPLSGASGAPSWSTATYPSTVGVSQILYGTSSNVIGSLATANNGVLITGAGGVPSISSTLPTAVQSNITQLGTQSQALNMGSNLINFVATPVASTDAANKAYVDQNALNGTTAYAASAATLGTVTQSGAGVGATLTNAGTQATFALDGVNPPVGSTVLIKNTATGMTAANEGLYTVTNAGSGSSNWVLTRATDFDTPTDINDTGIIVIQNGNTLAGTGWYNVATITTVDTTNFNFVQFATGTVTSFSIVSANGYSGSVANATTTPALTINKTTAYTVAGLSSTQTDVTGDGTEATLICNNVISDPGSNYNATTGVFTAPVTGAYQVSGMWGLSGLTSSHTLGYGYINVNGSDVIRPWYTNVYNYSDGSGSVIIGGSLVVTATAGQGIKLTGIVNNGTKVVSFTNSSWVSFVLIH